jgi:hypothetical protein
VTGDRSKNQAMVAAMSLVALYGLLFLYSGVAGLFGARLYATTIRLLRRDCVGRYGLRGRERVYETPRMVVGQRAAGRVARR